MYVYCIYIIFPLLLLTSSDYVSLLSSKFVASFPLNIYIYICIYLHMYMQTNKYIGTTCWICLVAHMYVFLVLTSWY